MKGELLAHGTTGLFGMIDFCCKNKQFNYETTILEHEGDEWWIYERKDEHGN